MGSPYPGIRPFREDEQFLFFGREAQVDAMVDALARRRFLAVIGSSGSGKSSLVNCGLIPALHRGLLASAGTAWSIARCRPGSDPLHSLALALAQPQALGRGVAPGPFSEADLIEASLAMSRVGLVEVWRQAAQPPGTRLLLVVDQFEELFRFRGLSDAGGRAPDGPRPARSGDADAAAGTGVGTDTGAEGDPSVAFVNLLLEAARSDAPIYIVLTMRSDFLGDCARFGGLPEAINGGQYLVPRMSRAERREAIEGPARVFGAEISPPLVTRMVNDAGDDPDQLSLLQHALARSWDHAQRAGTPTRIELADYEAIGTLARALNQHAEEILAGLDLAQQSLCGAAFRALTDKSTDARGIRRPTRWDALCAICDATAEALGAALQPFRDAAAAFVMPPAAEALRPDSVIDLSHESLMRLWDRLRDWGEREAESARTLRRLADAADWHATGLASLWRDPELQFALDWRDRVRPGAAWARQYGLALAPALAFLDASRQARDAALAREADRAAAERRAEAQRQRQRRTLWLMLGVLAATALAVFALTTLWRRAERAAAAAESRQWAAQAGAELAARNLGQALGYAAAAWRRAPTFEARDMLLATLAQAPQDWWRCGQQGVLALAHSPDGRWLASAGGDGSLRLWDVATGRLLATLRGHTGPVQALVFAADGRRLVSGGADGSLRLWDLNGRQAVGAPMRLHQGAVLALALSSRGLLASAGADRRIVLSALDGSAAPKPLAVAPVLLGHQDSVTGLAFSADGQRLASSGFDGALRVWSPALSPRPLAAVSAGAAINQLVFAPDGRSLATAGADRHVQLWDSVRLLPLGPAWAGHTAAVRGLAFSARGGSLVSVGDDGQALVWDTARRDQAPQPLSRQDTALLAVSIRGDGRDAVVAAAGAADVLRLQSLRGIEPLNTLLQGLPGRPLARASAAVRSASTADEFAFDGVNDRAAASGNGAASDSAGDATTGSDGEAWALAFSPDGGTLARADNEAQIHLQDPVSGVALGPALAGHSGLVTALAFSPDGRWLASAGQDGRVILWPYQPRPPHQPLQQPAQALSPRVLRPAASALRRLRFSPDGGQLAAAGQDGLVHLWELPSGRELNLPMRLDGAVADLAYAPRGRLLAVAGMHGELRLWDAAANAERKAPQLPDTGAVYGVAFRPDGAGLALATQRQGLLWWQPGGTGVSRLGQDKVPQLAVAFSGNGRLLASADVDGAVRLWDAVAGQPLRVPLVSPEGPVLALAWSPDGRRLASSSWGRGVLLSQTAAQAWADLACTMLRRNPPRSPAQPVQAACAVAAP